MWVVMPAFDEAEGIGCALDALAAQAFDEFVLCVVDNGSRDATVEVVRAWSAAHPDVPMRLVHEPEKGVGAAADTGIRLADRRGATIVARTDADSIPLPAWAGEMRGSVLGGLDLVVGKPVPPPGPGARCGAARRP